MAINFKDKNIVIIGLIVICFILGAGVIFLSANQGLWKDNIVSSEEAVGLALSYINENILDGYIEASLVVDVKEEGDFYKFQIEIEGSEILSYVKKDGSVFFPQAIDLTEGTNENVNTEDNNIDITGENAVVLGNFLVSDEEVCKENEKPIVYFFGANWCTHCSWEHPVFEEVTNRFEGYISLHNNFDSEDDTDVFYKYSPEGYIPTLVLGCKYYRTGAGEVLGEEREAEVLTALICDLTDSQPASVCEEVKDLIE